MAVLELPERGLALDYVSHGPPDGVPVLLIMGLGMQRLAWPEALIQALVARGHRVVSFDNRDAGLSTTPPLRRHTRPALALLASWCGRDFVPPYTLADMAADTLALADALGAQRFHVIGASMGGMIAQHLAMTAPQRVLSLVSIMSHAGTATTPRPAWPVLAATLHRPPRGADLDRTARHFLRLFQVLGALAADDEAELAPLRVRLRATVQRAYSPEGTTRQLLAILAERDRRPALRQLRLPTLILHGSADPLIPVAAARTLAAAIPGAALQTIDGMGHYFSLRHLGPVIETIGEFLADG